MPESMFGRPLQHLLPSHPQPSPGAASGASEPFRAPLPFKDFRFSSIGKQPELLSRISLPQPDNTDYHSPSPSPSPTSTPPPAFTNDPHSSRPTLFQQLAGSLASRIQMNDTPSNDVANSAHGAASRFPTPPLRITTVGRAIEDASLIPPVEVLPQPPDSSPPTSASWAPNLEPLDVHNSAACTPLMNTTTIMTSQPPTPPTVATDTAPAGLTEPFSSMAVVDTIAQGLQPSPPVAADVDSLTARQEHLQSISARLANLAAPLLPPSQSPPPDPFSRPSANITTDQPSEPRHSSTPVALRHPYSANQSSDRAGSSAHENRVPANDSSLSLILSPTILTREFQSHDKAITAVLQNLHTVLNTVHRAQVDNETAFALRIRTFGERCAAFEQTRRTQEATLQQELQELQQKREELNAKEAMLASSEKENKAREETRNGVLAKRQAQEEEKRAAEAKRVQEVQEQISIAINELKKIEVLKERCQIALLARETIQDDLPTAPLEGMNEEETAAIKSRNDLLLAIKHLRRMHTDKVQKLEETNRTLSMLGRERKKREAEEAERRRVAEEEQCLRAHVRREPARILDEKRRQLEADKQRQEAENDRAQAQLLVEQQAHAEAQAHGLGRVEVTNDQTLKHLSHSEGVSPSQPQRVVDVARVRAAREENLLSEATTNVMDVDEDGGTSALHRAVPSSDIHTSPATSPSKQKKKKDKPISGGVMLAAPTSKASGSRLPPKLSAPPPPSSDHVAENARNPASTSPAIPAHAEGSHSSSFPAQLASVFNRTSSADIRSTPDYKHAFSRTPKSQTILDATNGGQELNIGPVAGVSPTQQNVNLRHLKRFRGRAEGNDSGDRSVRTIQVKSEEDSSIIPKKEEQDVRSREVQASLSMNPPASLPPRPAVIPPPRPRMSKKRHEALASQTDPSSSYPPETNELSPARREVEANTDGQPREALPRDIPSFQAMNVPAQLPGPSESTNSLLLGPVYAEPQPLESRINTSERPAQDRSDNYDTTPSEPASATSSQMGGEDPSRNIRRFTADDRRAHKAHGSRCVSDHYSPPSSRSIVPSLTQAYRRTDARLPQNPSNGPRAEPMRAPSPTIGRKRPSEFNDNEHGHRARRQRGDVWVALDNDHHRVDSYRPQWDPEPDERRAAYRSPTSPVDRIPPYPSDVPRAPYDNRTYAPEEPAVPAARWEPSYRRPENDDIYQRYPPPAPAYNSMEDQHHRDDTRVGHYEPMMEERRDVQSDPSLLARIHDTQRFPPRGRGRGESSRGRGEYARGRGRGVARGGTPLLERLTAGPSLGGRLT